jgi:hypothetical protein
MQIEILATQIANLCQAIKHIRDGRTERAIELLERGLDGCVIGLGHIQKRGEMQDQIGQGILIDALKAARNHRHRYPRHAKSKNGTADAEFQKIVQSILENIEK